MTTEELAEAWRNEEMDFEDALLGHLDQNFPGEYDLTVFFVLKLAISYSNMVTEDVVLEIDGERFSAAKFIERFDLHPFVNA